MGKKMTIVALEKEYAKCFPKKKNERDINISKLKNPKLKVLIQTVNRTEFYAAMMQLKNYRYKKYIVCDQICRSYSYYYVGVWGKIPVVIVQTDMSNHGVHSSWYETKKALYFMPQLEYIFSVGVCGGVAGKVELGDVVISKAIYGYSDVKRTPSGWIDRNLHFLCNETDAYRYFTHAGNLVHTDARVKPGIVLSGPWLIADAKAQKDLLEMSKEAIAFDMEGANIVQACSRGDPQCMIVKGVSDLADKEKSDDHQAIAATNAAKYLCDAMNQAHHLFSESAPNFELLCTKDMKKRRQRRIPTAKQNKNSLLRNREVKLSRARSMKKIRSVEKIRKQWRKLAVNRKNKLL